MNCLLIRLLPVGLVLLTGSTVLAQDPGGRPPEGATQEEKRAFYQKRAADRAKAAEMAAQAAPAATQDTATKASNAAAPASSTSMRLGGAGGASGAGGQVAQRPPEGATQEEKRAFYQQRAAEREKAGAPAAPSTGAAPMAAKPPAAMDHSAHMAAAGITPSAAGTTPAAASTAHAATGAAPATPASTAQAGEATRMRMSGMPGMAGMSGMSSMGGMRGGGSGSGPIWLSDAPPSRGDGAARGGMGGMGMGTRSGPPTKRLWLRAGTDPMKSGYAQEDAQAPPEVLLVRPQGALVGEALPPPQDGKKNLSFPMPVQGYYRLYATTRKLQGDTLNISVAKAEVSNFSHGGDEEERAQALVVPRVLESALIEIVREKAANEPTFFQLRSGEDQAFVVLQKGLPTKGARIRFVSHEGWSKELVTDEQGRATFQVVRDYFPPWDDFKKRFKATYLVMADVSAAEAGTYKDQAYSTVRYQSTLSGSYYPSPDDYRSYAWGLGLTVLFSVLGGVAIYVYRRKRVKSFKEVRFDETE